MLTRARSRVDFYLVSLHHRDMTQFLAPLTLLLCLTFAGSTLLIPDFGGFDADQFPVPQEDPPVQPAGYAFAIWGVIYLWLLAGAVFGLIRRRDNRDWQTMRLPLCLSLAIGTIWLPVAVNSALLAAVLIWLMLIPALLALSRAPVTDKGWAMLPVGLYAGWLSAASCVALGLVAAGWGLLAQDIAAFAFILLALVLASAVQNAAGRTPTYGIAVVWALVAIVVHNLSADTLNANPTVAALATGGAVTLAWRTFTIWRTDRPASA